MAKRYAKIILVVMPAGLQLQMEMRAAKVLPDLLRSHHPSFESRLLPLLSSPFVAVMKAHCTSVEEI